MNNTKKNNKINDSCDSNELQEARKELSVENKIEMRRQLLQEEFDDDEE